MKQTIEIEVPDGKVAVWEDGKLKFIDVKPQMPKTWEEFCKVHPIQPTEKFITFTSEISTPIRQGSLRSVRCERHYLPNQEAAEAHLALMQLHQLRDYYRQGWKPDWSNDDYKWVISTTENELGVYIVINSSEFLVFQTQELAEEFLNNFRDLIEQAKDLIKQ